jgi:3'(2'), 5'-bisphosphate nucleotidase
VPHEVLWETLERDLEREFRKYRSRMSELDVTIKSDKTLLTQADLAIEGLIVNRIRQLEPDAVIVAEEDARSAIRQDVLDRPERVWVIDPIDGTAEFVKPGGTDFCSVICLLQRGMPDHAFIVAPELGKNRTTLTVVANNEDDHIIINGVVATRQPTAESEKWASVTRERTESARPFEARMLESNYHIKTRTTSQSLDMLRTAVDVRSYVDQPSPQFDLFFRAAQKIWDGLAGLCLGRISGLITVDLQGNDRLPVSRQLLSQTEPKFDATLMGTPEAVSWFLQIV